MHALFNAPGIISPAIDKGNSGETTDQREFMRPYNNPSISLATLGNKLDSGAFEVLATTAAPVLLKAE